jgi:hypothetical protein
MAMIRAGARGHDRLLRSKLPQALEDRARVKAFGMRHCSLRRCFDLKA